ncbi:MAG: SH3 domain-containing protein, partial [Calditrichaeota bacterium]|nr:SH3 domain-containing protein [Calditrichota bacterium]
LAEIDVIFSAFEWNEDAGTSPNERRCKVKEAASLHEDPSENSKVLGPAPKDREFVILAEEWEWLLVQLPFGKQGYIHSKNVEILGS